MWIYLQLSLLSKNVALGQCHKGLFPTWALMIYLWYLDDPPQPLPCSSPAGSSVPWALGWPLHSKQLTQTTSVGPSFQQLSWWNAWHSPAQACPPAKINMQYVLLGFLELTPKISIYPDVDILMSNGQSSKDTLLVTERNSESHSEFQLDRDLEIVNSKHLILG